MKILIFAAMIELPDDNETENDPSLVPKPTTPDDLLSRLLKEAVFGRNPDIWSDKPHYGPIFEV